MFDTNYRARARRLNRTTLDVVLLLGMLYLPVIVLVGAVLSMLQAVVGGPLWMRVFDVFDRPTRFAIACGREAIERSRDTGR